MICVGSLVAGRNVEYKYEKSEYHHDGTAGDGYIMVDGHPEGEESYYYDDGSSSDSHYHYPQEEVVEQEEYHIEYGQKHHPHHHPADHRVNQYEQHYVQEETDRNGRKLVKTDYDYERKSNQVVIQEEAKPNPPSKRVHIKLPEFDYSSYTKTDSEVKPVEKYDKPKREMKKDNKIGKHQYIEKAAPQPKYENIQRIPNEFSRNRDVVRRRMRVRPDSQQVSYKEKVRTLPEVVVVEEHNNDRRSRGKPRRIPVKIVQGEGKDHVLYYVDQPVQVYDPQEKKFHQFDRLSEKEAEEIKKGAVEPTEAEEKA